MQERKKKLNWKVNGDMGQKTGLNYRPVDMLYRHWAYGVYFKTVGDTSKTEYKPESDKN